MTRFPYQNYGASRRTMNPAKPWRAWYRDGRNSDRYAGLYVDQDAAIQAAKIAWQKSRSTPNTAALFLRLPVIRRDL